MKSITPLLIHVPHSSTWIPSDEWQYFVSPRLAAEILCMTDHYCDDLFECGHEMLRFPISRLVCDVERFRDDEQEIMSKKGMGVVYTRCSDGTELRRLTKKHKNLILKEYYDKHHSCFESAVEERLRAFNKCLIVDGHSFYDEPLPYEYQQDKNRPDICIGTDDYHTPAYIEEYLCEGFSRRGYSVGINTPFSGTIVPLEYYHTDARVKSVMIEVNRRLYIDRCTNKTKNYPKVKEDISGIVNGLADYVFRFGQ